MDYKHEYQDDQPIRSGEERKLLRFFAALIILSIPAWMVFNLVMGILHLKGH